MKQTATSHLNTFPITKSKRSLNPELKATALRQPLREIAHLNAVQCYTGASEGEYSIFIVKDEHFLKRDHWEMLRALCFD